MGKALAEFFCGGYDPPTSQIYLIFYDILYDEAPAATGLWVEVRPLRQPRADRPNLWLNKGRRGLDSRLAGATHKNGVCGPPGER